MVISFSSTLFYLSIWKVDFSALTVFFSCRCATHNMNWNQSFPFVYIVETNFLSKKFALFFERSHKCFYQTSTNPPKLISSQRLQAHTRTSINRSYTKKLLQYNKVLVSFVTSASNPNKYHLRYSQVFAQDKARATMVYPVPRCPAMLLWSKIL